MQIITSIKEQKKYCNSLIKEGNNISLIPTMGNLHDGHESLFLLSNSLNNKKIVSLFINPLQFDDNDDYKCYPKSIDKDISILERNNIDCLFMPTKNEVMINIDVIHAFDRKR